MKQIRKVREPERLFRSTDTEWETLDPERLYTVARALSSPIRKWIYDSLSGGAVRQAELAKRASKATGERITQALLRHHLALLEQAGLIGSETNSRGWKMVYRSGDIRVQMRRRAVSAEDEVKSPEPADEFVDGLKKILKKGPGEGSA